MSLKGKVSGSMEKKARRRAVSTWLEQAFGSGLQLCAEQGRELGRIAHVQRQRRLERAHLHAHRRLARRLARRLPRLRGGGDARLLRTP